MGEAHELDKDAPLTGRASKEDLTEPRKELCKHLTQFEGLSGKFEELRALRARPVTMGVLRTDGAPNQRRTEIDKMAAGFGAVLEHNAPHDHKSMGRVEGLHSGDLKSGMAQLHDAGAPVVFWCFFMENVRNSDNYVPRRGKKLPPYALAEEVRPNALAQRCKRAGCLAFCHLSIETRTKMDLRVCAAILLCEAAFSGYAGYWFLFIESAVLFVCDSFAVIEMEMPFRDPRVWECFEMPFNDRNATFEVQVVAKHLGGLHQ